MLACVYCSLWQRNFILQHHSTVHLFKSRVERSILYTETMYIKITNVFRQTQKK
jgi:hypothetical protein